MNKCGCEKPILWRSEYRGHPGSDREPASGPPEAAEGVAGVHRHFSGSRWEGRLPMHRKHRLWLAWPGQTPRRGRCDIPVPCCGSAVCTWAGTLECREVNMEFSQGKPWGLSCRNKQLAASELCLDVGVTVGPVTCHSHTMWFRGKVEVSPTCHAGEL